MCVCRVCLGGEEAIESLQGIVVLGGDWGALAGVMCDRCSRITIVRLERTLGAGPRDACSSAAALTRYSGQAITMTKKAKAYV